MMLANIENEAVIRSPESSADSDPGQTTATEPGWEISEEAFYPPPPAENKTPYLPDCGENTRTRYHGYYCRSLAYVCNQRDNSVSLVEIPTGRAILNIPVGNGPYGIDISPDRQFIYVSNMYDATLSVISTRSNQVVHTIALNIPFLDSRPAGVKVSPDGKLIYVANYLGNSISVLDAEHEQVLTGIPLPEKSNPLIMDITSDGRLAFITLNEADQIAVADLQANLPVKYLACDHWPAGITVSGKNSLALTASYSNNTLSVINTAIAEASPITIAVSRNPVGVIFSHCGRIAYVGNSGDNTVGIVDVFSHLQTNTIKVGTSPKGLALTEDDQFLVVSNLGESTVSIINTGLHRVVATAPVGNTPEFIAILNE